MAATHTFSVNTQTLGMRLVKWLLIGCGLLIVTGNIYDIIQGTDPDYLNMITGVCFLFIGFQFDHYFGSTTIDINSDMITLHRKKIGLMPEKHQQVCWKNICRVALYYSSIRLTDKSNTTIKFRLPNYTRSQFQDLKGLLAKQAEQHNADFEIRSWW